jgi:hypothetical protein
MYPRGSQQSQRWTPGLSFQSGSGQEPQALDRRTVHHPIPQRPYHTLAGQRTAGPVDHNRGTRYQMPSQVTVQGITGQATTNLVGHAPYQMPPQGMIQGMASQGTVNPVGNIRGAPYQMTSQGLVQGITSQGTGNPVGPAPYQMPSQGMVQGMASQEIVSPMGPNRVAAYQMLPGGIIQSMTSQEAANLMGHAGVAPSQMLPPGLVQRVTSQGTVNPAGNVHGASYQMAPQGMGQATTSQGATRPLVDHRKLDQKTRWKILQGVLNPDTLEFVDHNIMGRRVAGHRGTRQGIFCPWTSQGANRGHTGRDITNEQPRPSISQRSSPVGGAPPPPNEEPHKLVDPHVVRGARFVAYNDHELDHLMTTMCELGIAFLW